jgi:hypothetical protein
VREEYSSSLKMRFVRNAGKCLPDYRASYPRNVIFVDTMIENRLLKGIFGDKGEEVRKNKVT